MRPANTKYNPNMSTCTIHALKYNCNEIRTKEAKTNPTKVFQMAWCNNTPLGGI